MVIHVRIIMHGPRRPTEPASGGNGASYRGIQALTVPLCDFHRQLSARIPLAFALRQPRVIQSTAGVLEERNAALQT